MSGGQSFAVIYSVLLLVLVGSAFISYRLPLKQSLKMALVWVLIFAAGVGVAYGIENVFDLGGDDDMQLEAQPSAGDGDYV